MNGRKATVAALVVSVVTLIALTGAMVVDVGRNGSPRFVAGSAMMRTQPAAFRTSMGGGSMMGAQTQSPVRSISEARRVVARLYAGEGLHPGEIIQFSNGFYVELKDQAGLSATEVLVDPVSGVVHTEFGPAMMWNTSYGAAPMMGRARSASSITANQVKAIAQSWLDRQRTGSTVMAMDAYPGYYTVDFTSNGTFGGMLSVNASTGEVWFHTWHGRFIAREDS